MTIQPELLPRLALAELQRVGYTEDLSSRRGFYHHYALVVAFGILFAAAAIFLMLFPRQWPADWGGGIGYAYLGGAFLCGVVMAVGAATSSARGTAYSLRSGRQMFCFRRSDPSEDQDEIIYVDQESRTFFCQAVPLTHKVRAAS